MPQAVVEAEALQAALQTLWAQTGRERSKTAAIWSIDVGGLSIEWGEAQVALGDSGDGFGSVKLSGALMRSVRDRAPTSGNLTVGFARGKLHVASMTYDVS